MAITADPAASASDAALAQPEIRTSDALIVWHLLSLDAPTVAMLWTWFIARSNHIRLPTTAIIAMGLAVWMLYAADRLLDARLASADADLERRHYFHRDRQRQFLAGIVSASLALGLLLPGLAAESIHLYLILGAMLFAYFILIHAGSTSLDDQPRRMPKELAVGVFFSAATFIPTVARQPAIRLALLPAAFLFAFVCSLNCLFIYAWEHAAVVSIAHPATRLALGHLKELTIVAALFGCCFAVLSHGSWAVPLACTTAATLLMLLHLNRRHLDPTTLRAAADLCLLTPILFVPFLQRL